MGALMDRRRRRRRGDSKRRRGGLRRRRPLTSSPAGRREEESLHPHTPRAGAPPSPSILLAFRFPSSHYSDSQPEAPVSMADDAGAGRTRSRRDPSDRPTRSGQFLIRALLRGELEERGIEEIPEDTSVHHQQTDEPPPSYNTIRRGEGTLMAELREATEQLRLSFYANTDEETRAQMKQFWDEEFNAISEEATIERGLEWMRAEVVEAFSTHSGANVVEYELEDISHQCLIFDDCAKSYHHYNFIMKSKCPDSHLESLAN
uniref:DUF3615 domain-containing protein n=1 Tax=Oryza rufipogon TaxID=4529 RepID=A0A0E0R1X4_ORYRU